MAFAKSVFPEMIIKSSLIFILVHLLSIKGDELCPENFAPCANQTDCIRIEHVCMANHRCVDSQGHDICHHCGEDAGNTIACVTKIKPKLIFECLSPNQMCDGHKSCLNNDDEESCGMEKCASDSWPCANGKCIKKQLLCDTRFDCTDGSDEGDFCRNHICGANKFRCRTGECIPRSQVCDGIAHCPDEDDEEHCLHSGSTTIIDSCSIASNTFMCSSTSSICISIDRLCDGYQDCPKGDDEINCNETCSSESKYSIKTNVTCIRHPIGHQLYRCKQGYQLSTDPAKICQDIDECNDSLGVYCSFGCNNTDASYHCECPTGYSIDQETKTCRKNTDQSKADFLILYEDNISLYNIWNTTNEYSFKLFRRIVLDKTHHFNQIQYDPLQMFLIYYDSIQRSVFCKSSVTDRLLILISNITMNTFAYNANDRTLFLLEKFSQTLRMYTSITCEMPGHIQMHSWSLFDHFNPIQSMAIDFEHRQILFATKYEIRVSTMFKPNRTKIVYFSDREIKRIIYDNTFKRIIWTTVNRTHQEVLLVHTCQNEFKKCFDTRIVLQTLGPFVFFNDGLLYAGSSGKSLDFVQIYGKYRFSDRVLTSTEENIHSFLLLDQQPMQEKNLCMENAAITRCKNQLCLQINASEINCLSIDASFDLTTLNPSNIINSNTANQRVPSIADKTDSPVAKQRKPFFRRISTKIILSMFSFCVVLGIISFVVKRYRQRFTQRTLQQHQQQIERYSTLDEPTLDEFSVTVDDRNHDRSPLTNQLHY